MGECVELKTNKLVERLQNFQPFDAGSSELYFEHTDQSQPESFETRAFGFLKDVVNSGGTSLVVLTGNAGHGKTHLCGRLLKHIGTSDADVLPALIERCDGEQDLHVFPSGKSLRIIKDLSDFSVGRARELLRDALNDRDRITVVCANEGRLRAATNEPDLRRVTTGLELALTTGVTRHGDILTIDLNHQSVASHEEKNLVRQLMSYWTDQRKWTICQSCDARPNCPIWHNQSAFAGDEAGERRTAALETLLRVAERTGHVITIRDLLVLVSRMITAGVSCSDVHSLVAQPKSGWQANLTYHEMVFGGGLTEEQIQRFEVFVALRLLDPGKRAIRAVDDAMTWAANDAEGRFVPQERRVLVTPKTKREQRSEANQQVATVRYLRRRDYFNSYSGDTRSAERLGLRHLADFEALLSGDSATPGDLKRRDKLLRGLQSIQGVRRSRDSVDFVLVDPSFAGIDGPASIVARKLTNSQIEIVSQTDRWRQASGGEIDVPASVDWIDRQVHVIFPSSTGEKKSVALDLRQVEFVMRAAEGLNSRAFFRAEIRRLMGQLAGLTEGTPDEQITILRAGKQHKLVIEQAGMIRAVTD